MSVLAALERGLFLLLQGVHVEPGAGGGSRRGCLVQLQPGQQARASRTVEGPQGCKVGTMLVHAGRFGRQANASPPSQPQPPSIVAVLQGEATERAAPNVGPLTVGSVGSGSGGASSCGACSNSESSTLVTIFFTPRPVPLPAAGLRDASSRGLPATAGRAAAEVAAAGAAAGAAEGAAAAAPLLAAGGAGGGAVAEGAGAAMLPQRLVDAACCGEKVGDPGSADPATPSLAASFSSCLRYSWAAREVYFASILSLPNCRGWMRYQHAAPVG